MQNNASYRGRRILVAVVMTLRRFWDSLFLRIKVSVKQAKDIRIITFHNLNILLPFLLLLSRTYPGERYMLWEGASTPLGYV
jgi:hypothetical protein